jgi:hypothetical protein
MIVVSKGIEVGMIGMIGYITHFFFNDLRILRIENPTGFYSSCCLYDTLLPRGSTVFTFFSFVFTFLQFVSKGCTLHEDIVFFIAPYYIRMYVRM